jgi:NTE family protein
MSKKLGFALGAGGSRGVAHIGFLKAMEENGIVPDYISGCSMGSVVGACYAMGMSPDQMMEEVSKLKFTDIFDLSLDPFRNGALLRAKKMHKKLKRQKL